MKEMKTLTFPNGETYKIVDADAARKSDIPTKTSELTNDSGYLTFVPSEYVTETELNAKGYLTQHQDISGKANASDLTAHTGNKDNPHGVTASQVGALPTSGGTISGGLTISDKVVQGSPSDHSTIASMNRFHADMFVQGNGAAPNSPDVPGFYLGKSTTDENRHMDIVSGGDYSYIDFNKAGRGADYDARLLVNVTTGLTAFMWGNDGALTQKVLDVQGTIQQHGVPVALINQIPTVPSTTETWTFTLEDGSTVTKKVYVG